MAYNPAQNQGGQNQNRNQNQKPKEPAKTIHAEHGDVSLTADGKYYKVPVLVVAKKGDTPLQDKVRVSFRSALFDCLPTDVDGISEFTFDQIPVTAKGKQTLTVFVGSQKFALTIDLPEEENSKKITVIDSEVKLIGNLFQLVFKIQTEPPGMNVQLWQAVRAIGGYEKSDTASGMALLVRNIKTDDAGQMVVFTLQSETGEVTRHSLELPALEKVKTPCLYCNGSKLCKTGKTSGKEHSCHICRHKAGTRNLIATVACSHCS